MAVEVVRMVAMEVMEVVTELVWEAETLQSVVVMETVVV